MSLASSKFVPAAFWVGFLALGFITSFSGPDRHRVVHAARPTAKTVVASEALVAESGNAPALRTIAAEAGRD